MKAENKKEKAIEGLFSVVGTFLAAMVCVFIAFVFFFRIAAVDGNSMEPNLHSGENVLVTATATLPDYGQIIAIGKSGRDGYMVKRVAARGGDVVKINFNTHMLTVNDRVITEHYHVQGAITVQGDITFPLTVPEGCVFVLGDNRNDSLDSRFSEIGCIRQEEILGVVRCSLFPFGFID